MEPSFDNLSDAIFHFAKARPDAPAVHEEGKTITYGQLATLIGKTSSYLHEIGVKAGDMVGMSLPNDTDHVLLTFALLRIGAVPVDIPLRRPSHIDPFQVFAVSRIF